MKLIHLSDSHGRFPELPSQDAIVVHTGDFLPNKTRGELAVERRYQTSWLRRKLARVKGWLAGRPFVFVSGNHDFISPVPMLEAAGIDAHDATHRHVTVRGVTFYGFPCIPWLTGEWNHERKDEELERDTRALAQTLVGHPADILVLHSPPRGILDATSYGRIGNRFLAEMLREPPFALPRMILCGHVHEDSGLCVMPGARTLVSQAATTVHSLDLDPA